MPHRVFAISAHPDDIEFVMAGTMMHLKDAGCELHYLTIANGCCGSLRTDASETARIRREESLAAAEFIGATYHESLTNDLEIFYELSTLQRLSSIVRTVSPTIILTHSPQDYMEDHMNTSRLAVTAAFSRGMPNFQVVPPQPAVAQDVTIYHAQPHGNQDALRNPVHPELIVNVEKWMDRKAAMLALHRSQKEWLDESQGMESYLESMRNLNQQVADLIGTCQFAEGWRRHSSLGFCDSLADPLQDLIGNSIDQYKVG